MADFPSLTREPTGEITEAPATDAADLRSPVEAGYVVTRQRFTRVPTVFSVRYTGLVLSDYTALKSFIDDHGTTVSFNWTHPYSAVVHEVRFQKRPRLVQGSIYWRMDCELEEV